MEDIVNKAKELVKSFKPYSYYDAHDLTSRFRREESNVESAIECALIAIDEVIKALEEHQWQNRHTIEDYKLMKLEVEKL
jgi:hypothetical protein